MMIDFAILSSELLILKNIIMNYTISPVEFKVPLTAQAYKQAINFSQGQKNPEKSQQVYLNSLAVYAVNFYCQCMEIETDFKNSMSSNLVSSLLMDVSDLEIPGFGTLECRPVLPEAKVVHIPQEVSTNRIGYVVVEINEKSNEAILLGFIKNIYTEVLHLNQLGNLEDLLDEFELYLETSNVFEPIIKSLTTGVVTISDWLANLFEPDWQSPELVFAGVNPRNRRKRLENINVSRAKLIDLGIQLADDKIALLVEVTKTTEDELVDILLQVLPTDNSILPEGLKLIVLDENSEEITSAESRNADSWIQLDLEEGKPGDKFKVQITLRDVSITEDFVI
ncbi:MAG: DUF1822 family protein [Scytonematopsis contorta HA4267-MV1]|jgi:hypothetical protein|nr:DUF1822 family protein [Scytonematopsis contorta HA4267-MV1]